MDEGLMYYVVRETSKVFPHKISMPEFKVVSRERFSEFVLESPISEHIEEEYSFIAHLPEGEIVCLCLEKFNEITKGMQDVVQNLFLQAVVLHELYHIWNKTKMASGKQCMTEKEIHDKMKKEFPLWENLLQKASSMSAPEAS